MADKEKFDGNIGILSRFLTQLRRQKAPLDTLKHCAASFLDKIRICSVKVLTNILILVANFVLYAQIFSKKSSLVLIDGTP